MSLMANIVLSILIATVSERTEEVAALVKELEKRADGLPVEILWLGDNRKRTLSKKREALVRVANGKYVCHLDDDDGLAQDFMAKVLAAAEKDPDVISYNQQAMINGENPFIVRSSIQFENEHTNKKDGFWQDIKRKPWHWCTWRTEIAKAIEYPDLTYGEDWAIVSRMLERVKTEEYIDEVMHYYIHVDKKTTCDGSV
jgi:hypothetical protein